MRTLQLLAIMSLAVAARADILFEAGTPAGQATVDPDPWFSGPAVAESSALSILVAPNYPTEPGYVAETDSMTAVIEPGASLGDGTFAPGGSFDVQLSSGGEIVGYFSGPQTLATGLYGASDTGGAPVVFGINPELATFTEGATLFSGTLEVFELSGDPGNGYVDLVGVAVPEPSSLLLLAVAGVILKWWSR